MELKVWVEGIQRIVCGVTETTTCQDIVFALAHATGKTGRFTLIEKWRNNERIMAPSENPLKILIKWGEYSSDVQFILQKSQTAKPQIQNNSNSQRMLNTDMPLVNNASEPNSNSPEKSKDIPKSLGPSNEEKLADNVGIVRPQKPLQDRVNSPEQYGQFNSADIRNSLDRLTFQNNQQDSDVGSSSTVLSKAMSSIDSNDLKAITSSPPISANGALMPPPYRNPPPPKQTENNTPNETKGLANSYSGGVYEVNENYLNAAHYVDLVQLITMQRDKLNMQQSEINKCDAEINYFENKEREHLHKIELMNGELVKLEQIYRQGKDQLQMLQYVEEENELVKQQEKTLKSEIMLLRSKLANCETELLQYRNKIKLLMDDIQIEQEMVDRNFSNHQDNMERQFFVEMERLQSDIQQAIQQCDSTAKANESLKTELHVIEDAIVDKKKEVELLFNEMKEVNLQSLTATSSEEIRNLLDVSNRPGSTRRILGSPRQLENAVPTSKNPHGVWV